MPEKAGLVVELDALGEIAPGGRIDDTGNLLLDSHFSRTVQPFHDRSQPVALRIKNRIGCQCKMTSANADLRMNDRGQPGQHVLLVPGVAVENIHVAALDLVGTEARQPFADIRFGGFQHGRDTAVHEQDVSVIVSNHHVGIDMFQGRTNAGIFDGQPGRIIQPGKEAGVIALGHRQRYGQVSLVEA